jgi:hypothetical protein
MQLHLHFWTVTVYLLLGSLIFAVTGCRTTASNVSLRLMNARTYYDDTVQVQFVEAVGNNDVATMEKWLRAGGNVNAIGRENMHPLFWAVAKRSFVGFDFLLRNGSDPQKAKLDSDGLSLYRVAAGGNEIRFLRLLLKHGMDPDQSNESNGNTVMFDAILSGRMENVKTLVEAGANLNHQDDGGKTPLHIAAGFNNYDMVLYLLQSGADPTLTDIWGYDLAGMIRRYGDRGMKKGDYYHRHYLEVVEELKRRGLLP